jgi:hypothetical protein
MGSITSYCRKALVTIVSLSFIFNIQSANASTLAGGSGWRVASTVSNGVGVTVNGVKDVMVNGAKKTMTGVANVTPTAAQVGKFMRNNLGAAAVVGAMDLLLDGVDYVLDPANNSVTYHSNTSEYNHPSKQYIYELSYGSPYKYLSSVAEVCREGQLRQNTDSTTFETCYVTGGTTGSIAGNSSGSNWGSVQANPAYDPANTDNKPKTVSLANIGQQVIDQAQEEVRTGNPAVPIATPVTQAAAAAVVGEAAKDEPQARPIVAELDKSAAIPADQTAVGEIAPPITNPETGEVKPDSISLDFPVFCSWASSMCVLADKVQQAISDVATEYADKPQENTDTELEIPDPEEQSIDSDISFGGSCPASRSVPVSFAGINTDIEFSFQWFCEVASIAKPVVVSISAFAAALIVAGVRTEDD